MRSLRLDAELDAKVRRAASIEGLTVSEFIRQAVSERADKVLGAAPAQSNSALVTELIGELPGGGGNQARRSGAVFADLLEQDHARQTARPLVTG